MSNKRPSHNLPAALPGCCSKVCTPCKPEDMAAKLWRIVMLRSFSRSFEPFSVSSVLWQCAKPSSR